MNLLLLEREELRPDGTCTLADRRAVHLKTVLGVTVGATVRAGIAGGAAGSAEVIAIDGGELTLRFTSSGTIPAPMPVELVLAIPRPKVITRTIEIAASFAVRRIDLTNAWRVDKSYLGSPRLESGALALAARFGAEQGATTFLPEIAVHDRLMALIDARFAAPRPHYTSSRIRVRRRSRAWSPAQPRPCSRSAPKVAGSSASSRHSLHVASVQSRSAHRSSASRLRSRLHSVSSR